MAYQRSLPAVTALLALASACSHPAPSAKPRNAQPRPKAAARSSPPAPEAPAPAAPTPPPPSPALPEATLVVGGPEGIVEVGFDGKPRRTLTTTPAARPRFAPGGNDILFFVPHQSELRAVSRDGRERTLAKIPLRKGCAPPNTMPLTVHEDKDFIVDPRKGVACLRFTDRNANMASVGVIARVDLASTKLKSAVWLSLSCKEDPNAEALFDCAENVEPYQNGQAPAATRPGLPAEYREESMSPSGRWAVVTGNVQEGDYIHRDLYLLDTSAGRLHPVVTGAWPPPIAADKIGQNPGETVDVVGESTIRWIGVGDWLLVDNLLIAPGYQVVDLPGDIAR